MMTDMAAHPHDAPLKLNDTDWDVLASVDGIVSEARQTKNVQIAFRFGKALRRTRQVQGYALAKLLYDTQQLWAELYPEGDTDAFIDEAAAQLAYSPETIRKYLKVWEWCIVRPGHPQKRMERLLGHEIDSLYRLAAASKEGEMDEEMWEDVAAAPNKEAIMEIRDNVIGERTSSASTLKIMLERDGTIKARRGGGAYRPVGVLNTNLKDDDVVVAAIERIYRRSGMFGR